MSHLHHNNSSSEQPSKPNYLIGILCMVSVWTMFAFTFAADRDLTRLENNAIESADKITSITDFYERNFKSTMLMVKAINVIKEDLAKQGSITHNKVLKQVLDSLQSNVEIIPDDAPPAELPVDSTDTKPDTITTAPVQPVIVTEAQASRLIRKVERLEDHITWLTREYNKSKKDNKNLRSTVMRQKRQLVELQTEKRPDPDENPDEPRNEKNYR